MSRIPIEWKKSNKTVHFLVIDCLLCWPLVLGLDQAEPQLQELVNRLDKMGAINVNTCGEVSNGTEDAIRHGDCDSCSGEPLKKLVYAGSSEHTIFEGRCLPRNSSPIAL